MAAPILTAYKDGAIYSATRNQQPTENMKVEILVGKLWIHVKDIWTCTHRGQIYVGVCNREEWSPLMLFKKKKIKQCWNTDTKINVSEWAGYFHILKLVREEGARRKKKPWSHSHALRAELRESAQWKTRVNVPQNRSEISMEKRDFRVFHLKVRNNFNKGTFCGELQLKDKLELVDNWWTE